MIRIKVHKNQKSKYSKDSKDSIKLFNPNVNIVNM